MEGRVARGVELVDLTTDTVYEVPAQCVVLAADTLRTPQLLFASDIRPPALGHYLNEHPYVDARAVLDEAWEGDEPTGMPELTAYVSSSGVTWVPFYGETFPFQGGISQNGKLLAISFFLPKEPAYENYITFSDTEVDWRGLPEMTLHYRLSERDLERVERARQVIVRILEVYGLPNPDVPELLPNGTSLHYQGTVRMGSVNDGTSVCDRHSRVWGTENLFVAGNCVIPTATACNPTLTSVALAILGAEEVARVIQHKVGAFRE